jgi:hypothetical protein
MSLKREYKYTITIIVLNIVYIFTDLMVIASLISINVYGYNQTYISRTSNESAIASFIYIFVIVFAIFIVGDLIFFVNLFTNMKFKREEKRLYFDWWARRFFKKDKKIKLKLDIFDCLSLIYVLSYNHFFIPL